jgi:Family of unknown function (DUF5994)
MTRTGMRDRATTISSTPPTTPRLRLESSGAHRTLLDGGWWPRSSDPVAELPGLILAIDARRGLVTRLLLPPGGWDSHPRRLGVAGRVVRLGYFVSQPAGLLTAVCANRERIDLLVVPPDTAGETAHAAMLVAATVGNLIHAQDILLSLDRPAAHATERTSEAVWDAEGGRLAAA